MINLQKLLIDLKQFEENNLIPSEIKNALGNFLWCDRVSNVEEIQAKKIRISFYADDLTLSDKSSVEELIHKYMIKYTENFVVFFTKKHKISEHKKKTSCCSESGCGSSKSNCSSSGCGSSKTNCAESNCESSATHCSTSGGCGSSNCCSKTNTPPQSQSSTKQTRTPTPKRKISGVNRIIAVASGKGGVGKSTVSVNLALALYNQGYKVGILDADIYGPSVPTMLNVHTDPDVNAENKIIPPEAFGLKVMSFGFFAPEDTAVIWRGPMVMKALQQFFWNVEWGELDFLVIDLPPGTGDVQLTMIQSIPISGAVIVTTPQNVALLDAVKGIAFFEKTEIPILGLIENMSTFSCPSCQHETFIFGQGGAERVATKFSIPVLGHIPLVAEIRVASDIGEPLTSLKKHAIRHRFDEIAEKVVQNCVHV